MSATPEPSMTPTPTPINFENIPDYLPPIDPGATRPPLDFTKEDNIYAHLYNPEKSGKDKSSAVCATPPPVTSQDIFNKASDLAKSLGGDQTCIKSAENQSRESGSSSAYDTRRATNFDAEAHFQAQAFYGAFSTSGGASTSSRDSSSTTTADQSHATALNQSNLQSGCGSTLITASNMVQKQAAMQCVMNNISKDQTISSNIKVTVAINTLPLSETEAKLLGEAQEKLSKMQINNSNNIKAITLALIAAGKPASDVIGYIKPMTDFYSVQEANFEASMAIYNRDITIKNSTIEAKGISKVKVFSQLTTSAKSDLSTLAASVQKDAVAQTMANDMGTSAMDPNVKTMAQRACETSATSSSSSITNLLDSMKVSMDGNGLVTISACGSINISNTVISATVVAELCSQSILNQAVSNALASSSSFLTDTKNTTDVTNKVAGLNDLQAALGKTVSDAITANQKAIINSQDAQTAQENAYQKKVTDVAKALFAGDSTSIMVVIAVCVLLYFLFGRSGSQPQMQQMQMSQMPQMQMPKLSFGSRRS
jgi:hypothetical protein